MEMEERSCNKCRYMVRIKETYCYRTLLGFSTFEERNSCIPEIETLKYYHDYKPCGLEGKFFERKIIKRF